MKKNIVFLVLLLFSVGCDSQKNDTQAVKAEQSRQVPFQTLVQTGVSGVEKKMKLFEIIHDTATLQKFFPKIESEKLNSIDFSRETVLGVYGGDSIQIVALEKGDECINVIVKSRLYEENSPFYGIPYSPMHLVKTDKRGGCFEFKETVEVVQ